MSLTITGGFEAIAEIQAKREAVISELTKGMEQIGFYVEGKVKESVAGQADEPASVDTGRFLNSITTEISSDLATKQQQAIIFTPLDYPFFLEHGTTRIPARHHFQNTAFREQGKIREMMAELVRQATG